MTKQRKEEMIPQIIALIGGLTLWVIVAYITLSIKISPKKPPCAPYFYTPSKTKYKYSPLIRKKKPTITFFSKFDDVETEETSLLVDQNPKKRNIFNRF